MSSNGRMRPKMPEAPLVFSCPQVEALMEKEGSHTRASRRRTSGMFCA